MTNNLKHINILKVTLEIEKNNNNRVKICLLT